MQLNHRIARLEGVVASRPCPQCREHRDQVIVQSDQPTPPDAGYCPACGARWRCAVVRLIGNVMDTMPRHRVEEWA